MFDFLNKGDTAWKHLRGKDLFFFENNFASGYNAHLVEIDTRRSGVGMEILER